MNLNDQVTVSRKALRDFIANSACTFKGPEWVKNKAALLHRLSTAEIKPRTCGKDVPSGQFRDSCGSYWGDKLIQCSFCKGHDAAMRGEP